jgi:DNA polymerase-3 subunit alpha
MGFTVEDGKIRFGLSAVKNVGKSFVESMLKERDTCGEFRSFSDFIERMTGTDINKRAVLSLIACGAFDSMGVKRSQLMRVCEFAMDDAADRQRNNIAGQFSLFDDIEETPEIEFPPIPEFDKRELLRLEKQSTGLYFSGHPMDEYTNRVKKLTSHNISMIHDSVVKDEDGEYVTTGEGLNDGDNVVLACIIESRKNKTTRNKSQMAILTLEDSYGSVEALVFPKVLTSYSQQLQEGATVLVKGTVSIREDEEPKILLNSVESLDSAINQQRENPVLYIRLDTNESDTFSRVRHALAPFSGDIEVRL